jgi:phospholipid/cholesterol/gamma-HCH transport system permease protein
MDGEQSPQRRRPLHRDRPQPGRAAGGDFLADTFPAATSDVAVATEPGEPAVTALATPTSPTVSAQWVAPDYRNRHTVGDRISDVLPGSARRTLEAVGGLYTMFGASLYGLGSDLVRRKFQFNEFVERSWFLVSVALLPAILVSIPLGVAIALQVGALAAQIGATSFVGAADAIGVLREASPIVTALLLAGVGGSAVCAELGARTIREEIDAMIVLGLNPLRRLVAPLMVAGVLVAVFLNFVVIFVSIGSAYIFDLAALHGTKGSFFGSFTQFASVADFVTSGIKAAVFGLVAVMIAAYQGLNAKRGPTGVGEAVNQSVVVTGVVLFALNLVITEIFFAVVPQRTF